MSSRTILLVLLSVNLMLVQSKPASTEGKNVDSLNNQLGQGSQISQTQYASTASNQNAFGNALNDRSFMDWFQGFLQNSQGNNVLAQIFGTNTNKSVTTQSPPVVSEAAIPSNVVAVTPAQQEVRTPAVDGKFGGSTRGFNQIIITHSDDVSPVQPTLVGNGGEQGVQSSEALLDQLRGQQTSQTTGAVVSNDIHHILVTGSGYQPVDEAEFKRQAQNAKYQFATQVDDKISGNFQQRAEVREGTKVYGKYSYDDGFAWRTVYYQADEDGFKVTKEVVAPSHMTANVEGDVDVQSFMNGNSVNYHITRKDIGALRKTNQQKYGVENQQQQYGAGNQKQQYGFVRTQQ